ncbi:hypothetical protein Agabi119p4_199 [Agaricus bisporus var. burnettii]|uniref:C3H1-type domain-containing protein n=1 Tax=Agaricus bisporus var. burnettii TaxID=192524 RepID=A0A8H7FA95_AGABI|nr:hypothetical protein Agabi119p4_199 [Agaricus bisporus var. burnettii]
MAFPLLKACSEGNLHVVSDLLHGSNPVDIEFRDESGSTPLIEAVKNGHVNIIHTLLEKGADPSNGSPEQHTTDQVILGLLAQAKNKPLQDGVSGPESSYLRDGSDDSQKPFYPPPPPDAYPYYPTINPSLSTVPDGGVYYPPPLPPHMGGNHSPGGPHHLPPPEVARMIPCRYYPACRYGPSCIFLHPPQGYYPNGAPPPAPYPHYDPMGAPPFSPNFYPPPTYQQANGPLPMTPLSPPPGPPHIVHARSTSEIVSPTQGHFSPNGVSPPVPYGPMSPSYPHSAPMPVPLSGPPVPPLHHQPQPQLPPPGPQSPTNFSPSPVGPFNVQPDGPAMYPQQQPSLSNGNVSFAPEVDGMPKPQPGAEGFVNGVPHPHTRDVPMHARRSSRRASFGKPKPPCLFFPTGRCKNGDDCRFPHIMPDGTSASTNHHTPFYAGRGGGPRQPRGQFLHNGLEEKFNNMNIRDESQIQQNGVDVASKSLNTANDNGPVVNTRPRFPPSGKHHQHHPHHGFNSQHNHYNGKLQKLNVQGNMKQRVPNADDFPVLAGTITPPSKSPLTVNGPTAAQILQAPAPMRKEVSSLINGKEASTRGTTPERSRSPSIKDSPQYQDNGVPDDNVSSEPPANKLPVSFAAAATAAKGSAAPDIAKEVSVSA